MDLNELKEIIELDGGKFIIVENGKPIFVISSFAEYKKRLKLQNLAVKNKNSESKNSEDLTIEDLPV